MTEGTFAMTLSARLRQDPGQPLVTYYDGATGERVELSVTTYANWVAKASSLLVDELDLARGDTVRIELPPHWLTPVLLGAAWNAGLVVTDDEEPDAVVCGPATLDRWSDRTEDLVVLAASLLPMGVRFRDGVPTGVHDLGVEVWSQPDSFVPWDPPGSDDAAIAFGARALTHAQLWEAAAAGELLDSGGRLLSVANPASPPGIATFSEPLAKGGSLVLVAQADQALLETTAAAERVTARFPA